VKIFFLPYISAIRPNGRRKTVADRRYEVGIQANRTASISNSRPIRGSAMFIEEPINGVRNEAMVTTSNTDFLLTLLSFLSAGFCMIFIIYN
jgi:hypothetical protein